MSAKAPATTIPLSKLLAEVAERQQLSKKAIGSIFDDFVGLTVRNLKKGNKVRITGLGTFVQVRNRPARMGRNPATGEPIKIKASRKVPFRAAIDTTEDGVPALSRDLEASSGEGERRTIDPSILEEARRRAAGIKKAGVRHQSLAKFLATPEAREGYLEGEAAQWAADLIREMRKRRGFSQAELAKNLNVEPSRIGELERGVGRYGPTLGKLKQVANACGFKLVVGFE